jgi:carbohydrate-binding DOMON domain-containing protein
MSKNMQTPEAHHEELVKGLYDQMKMILDSSEQPIDIYLDDNHKACNSRFAALLGYKSPQEWADIKGFLDPFVAEKSQETVSSAYWDATKKMIGSTIQVTWKKKGGGTIDSTVIFVPMAYRGHLFAVHFVSNVHK